MTDAGGGNTSTLTAEGPSPPELVGRRLGEFVLRDCIGEGGFGAVYLADQPVLGRQAVVKVLHRRLRDSEIVLQRFMREALLASRLDHPYAAHVYAFGVEAEDGLAWIAMENVHGTTLDVWLGRRGALPIDELVQLFAHIAEVVQTAHDSGIVHRDLKPSNVMVIQRAGRVLPKLLDFGIAKLVDEAAAPSRPDAGGELSEPGAASSDPRLTQANVTLGSPPYMSPEQWLEPLSVGPAADLYSLGVMAYEALVGRRPFTGSTTAELAYAHCHLPVPPLGPEFSPALDAVFQRVLAKLPAQRPPSALEFMAELRSAASLPVKRRRAPWVLAAIAVFAVAAVASIIVIATRTDDARVTAAPPTSMPAASTPTTATIAPAAGSSTATIAPPAGASTPTNGPPQGASTAATGSAPPPTPRPHTKAPARRPPTATTSQEDLGAGRL